VETLPGTGPSQKTAGPGWPGRTIARPGTVDTSNARKHNGTDAGGGHHQSTKNGVDTNARQQGALPKHEAQRRHRRQTAVSITEARSTQQAMMPDSSEAHVKEKTLTEDISEARTAEQASTKNGVHARHPSHRHHPAHYSEFLTATSVPMSIPKAKHSMVSSFAPENSVSQRQLLVDPEQN